MARKTWFLPLLVAFAFTAIAFSSSACLWGVVKDAETGTPLSNVTVTYTDSAGGTASTMTDADGLYSFDQAAGPYPAAGAVTFEISRPGYDPQIVPRLVEYNDNPNASLANLSTFTEGQSFDLIPHLVQRVMIEITGLDIDQAPLSPPVMVKQQYAAGYQVFDPDDPATVVCEAASPWVNFVSADPVAVPLEVPCTVMGEHFLIRIAVAVHLEWTDPAPQVRNFFSTAAYDWSAPDDETDWQYETLDSDDPAGPDDPHLSFEAQIRFKSATGPEPSYISDVNAKENFGPIDRREILRRVVALPITSWNYIGDPAWVRHMGPMAQDFYAAFGLGNDRAISPIDTSGVAFAAIQELYDVISDKDAEIDALKRRVDDLSARVAALEQQLEIRK